MRMLIRESKLFLVMFILLFTALFMYVPKAQASSRIKDIVSFEGIRDNMLIGYGLVVGLNGTGDKLKNIPFAEKSLVAFLQRMGINANTSLKTKNVAAVTVTASLPPFSRAGSRVNVTVSTLGDAKSLQGGMLLVTPLMGADGKVYALSQGAVSIEGFQVGGAGDAIIKGVPTNGFIANGAIVEKEIAFDFNSLDELNLGLRNPDIATARRISEAINAKLKGTPARVLDPGTVALVVPESHKGRVAILISDLEQLMVEPDQVAKIVIDEASGTIVMGKDVKIDTVAIAQGNLVVRVRERPLVSQPGALAPEGAETVEVTQTEITLDDSGDKKLTVFDGNATLHELVGGLNALGVGPRDLISILHTIKVAGALHAEVVTR